MSYGSIQGKGVGSVLLAEIATVVNDRRPGSPMYLWVLERNQPAQGFYVARGGTLGDVEISAAPGNDPRNLVDGTRRVRVTWADPSILLQR